MLRIAAWDVNAYSQEKSRRRGRGGSLCGNCPLLPRWKADWRDRCKSRNVIHPGLFKMSFLWTPISAIADAFERADIGAFCTSLHEACMSGVDFCARSSRDDAACRANETVGRWVRETRHDDSSYSSAISRWNSADPLLKLPRSTRWRSSKLVGWKTWNALISAGDTDLRERALLSRSLRWIVYASRCDINRNYNLENRSERFESVDTGK